MDRFKFAAMAAFMFIAVAALAAVTVTESPGPHVLILADGTSKGYKTYAECRDAGPVNQKFRCANTVHIEKVGKCDPAEPPELPAETEAIAVQCPGNDKRWFNRAQGWEREDFPACGWQLSLLPREADPPFCQTPRVTSWDVLPGEDVWTPSIDPEFDEHSPTGPVDGPNEGPKASAP